MARAKHKFDSTDELELAKAWDSLPEDWVARDPVEQMGLVTEYRDHLGMGNIAKTPQFIPPDTYLKEIGMDPKSVRTPVEQEQPKTPSSQAAPRRITDVKEKRDIALRELYESSVPEWVRKGKSKSIEKGSDTRSPTMKAAYALGTSALTKLERKYTETEDYKLKEAEIRGAAEKEISQIREDRVKDPSNKRIIELLEDIAENTKEGAPKKQQYDYEPEERQVRGRKGFLSKLLGTPAKVLGGAVAGGIAQDAFGVRALTVGSVIMRMLNTVESKSSSVLNERNTTSSTKVDTSKMSFTERFRSLWEGDTKKDGEGKKEDKNNIFKSIFDFFKNGITKLFGKLTSVLGPLVGLFSKLSVVLGPVLALIGGFKLGEWVNKTFLTNEDGSNKIADIAMKVSGKDTFDPNKYDPVADMNYYRKAEAAGETISPALASRIEKLGIKVKPEMIRSSVSPVPSAGSKISQQNTAVVTAEAKREEIARKNEEAKHKEVVNAPKNVQVVAPAVNATATVPNINLSTRNPDSTLQTFLTNRMKLA